MNVEQRVWTVAGGWSAQPRLSAAQLILVFGSGAGLADAGALTSLSAAYPSAVIVGCSTAGEIAGTSIHDDTLVATAVQFAHTSVRLTTAGVQADSAASGRALADGLPHEDLRHVLVLSDGLCVNGSQLVEGLTRGLPAGVGVTGGLAGDGTAFANTSVMANAAPRSGLVAAVGLYGDRLRIGYGSLGGWDSFGPEREVTRSRGNVLYELDGQSALGLYKKYLGEHAAGLPASALLFPLTIRSGANSESLVRTVLSVNEQDQSMTFAGDVPLHSRARLMKANFDRLIDGATGAADVCRQHVREPADLAILISCVGRRIVLKQRTEEEVDAVRRVLGDTAVLTGFYSYGEISPFTPQAACRLHNQTMTITTMGEV